VRGGLFLAGAAQANASREEDLGDQLDIDMRARGLYVKRLVLARVPENV
jgi:hypothetical protein